MDFKSALNYLEKFKSYENSPFYKMKGVHFDLRKFKKFLQDFGVDVKRTKFIHVGGSKGKGSTGKLIEMYLRGKKYSVGVFSSPHFYDVRECFLLDGRAISKSVFSCCVAEIEEFLNRHSGKYSLSYFELLTAIALKFFVERKVDFAILEVGVGGKYDATNVISPKISIINLIEKEHAGILGGTLKSIIQHKIGIIKPGVPCVISPQTDHVNKELKKQLSNKKNIYFVGEILQDVKVEVGENGSILKFTDGNFLVKNLKLGKVNFFHYRNVLTAYFVLKILLKKIDLLTFKKVCGDFKLKGRFEIRMINQKAVVLDMAHTAQSFESLLRSMLVFFPDMKYVFLISLMKGKEIDDIFKCIVEFLGERKLRSKFIFVSSHLRRSVNPNILERKFESYIKKSDNLFLMKNCRISFSDLLATIGKKEILIVTGSHFLLAQWPGKKV